MKLTKIAALVGGVILISACGEKSSTNVTLPPEPALTGVFVDSPVSGLGYKSASVPDGVTNASGEFAYFRGEQLSFHIGDLIFPDAPASSVISPLDLFTTDNAFNQSVVNTIRLLQSLDTDGDASNGIELSVSAANVAVATLDEGQALEDFFNQSDADFAADVEVWLGAAGGASNTLVDKATALTHFVNYLETDLGTLFPNTFDATKFTGEIYAPNIEGRTVSQATYTFTPSDETNLAGGFVRVHGETNVTGTYTFSFGRKVITLNYGDQTEHLISRAYNTVNDVYSLCVATGDEASTNALALQVESCLAKDDPAEYLFTFTQAQADAQLVKLEEAANAIQAALEENFDTDTDTFFSSSYKRLSDEPDAGALYYVTGGSPLVDATTGQLTLEGDRFSIGNAAQNPGANTSASNTVGTGIYNLSEGFTISFDVISHNSGGSFSLYVDNNTTGQDNSTHGAASKFVSEGLADGAIVAGERFTYTYEPGDDIGGGDPTAPDAKILDSSVTNSFFQLRTDSSATITIDNLKIETIADAVEPPPPSEPDPTEPTEPVIIPSVSLPLSFSFAGESEDIFSTNFAAIENEAGEQVSMLSITGGAVTQIATGIELDGGRFTLGNTEPDVISSSDDTSSTGALDLSRPYIVVFDVISAEDTEGDNNFQIYVDNNTSGSANSHLGGDSRFFNEPVVDLVAGTTMTVEGQVATPNSYLQFRTESGSIVVIDNIHIEYIEANVLLDETFETDIDTFFSAEYKASDAASTPFYSVTGGGSGITITDGELSMDSARFTLGNTTPETDTTAEDTTTTGVLDLSREYTISMDVIAIEDAEGDNNFQLYVDNNTSSSGKSIHGSESKFYSELITSLTPGQKLTIEGLVATPSSFIQMRTESGGNVVIDNLVFSYVGDAPNNSQFSCDSEPELYFCDDFAEGSLDNFTLIADDSGTNGPQGVFDILGDDGNNVLRYTAGGEGGEILLVKETALSGLPESGNYYVESRIRPRQNSTTRNKQLFLMGRYDSAGNWYAGGLNVQNSSSSTQVEVAISTDDSIARPVQKKSPILLGEKDETDGTWYRVRFEMDGENLTVYLDGENMGSTVDSTYNAAGLIGIFTNNRSFEIDDLKVGNPSVKPIQLTLDYKEPKWETTTSSDPLFIYVTAVKDDGITEDTFTVTTSDANVATIAQDGPQVTLTPAAEGNTIVTITSGSDPTLVKHIEVTVEEGFTMPAATYGDLSAGTVPSSGNQNAYVDTLLTLTFDDTPTLGSSGEVRIYSASDDKLVDVVNVAGDIDYIGFKGQDRQRKVNYRPVYVEGNSLVVKPHTNALDYGHSYYVSIGDNVLTSGTLNGEPFVGLGKDADWAFSTREAAPSGTSIVVDDDAEADFRTVQGALNHIMQNVSVDTPSTVTIRDGEYREMLFLRGNNKVTLQGESRDNTLVYYDNFESFNSGSGKSEAPSTGTPSGGRSVFLIEEVDDLTFNNFTLKNSHIRSNAYSNQAETLYFNSDAGRLTAVRMNFVSEQDTLLLKGFSWFYQSLVAGNVDFIWGYVDTALFEESEIRTIGDSKNGDPEEDTAGGYILQARVPDITNKGFIFLNNQFTHGPGPIGNDVLENSTFIARSGGSANYFDNITLINNRLDTHIATSGWAGEGVRNQPATNPSPATSTAGWREYGSTDLNGNPLNLSAREFVYILSDSEVAALTNRSAIFSHFNNGDGWEPQAPDVPEIAPAPTFTASGFAQYSFDLTGGAGGTVVTVDNGVDLKAALNNASAANTPITIYIDGTITDANSGGTGSAIEIRDMNDVSIIGVANRGELDGIGILIKRANNVIIRNLRIHHVLTEGKDAISIEGDNDGSSTSNIWIDHNELYSTLAVDKDFYDGLVDSKRGAKNITISYNYLHDHWKASLHGHTESDTSSANTERLITFHHNRFENIESRLPLFRYGHGHLYNNYYNQISSTAINSRIGAELQIENNVFENTKNPIVSFYSDVIGYWNTSGNVFGEGVTWSEPDEGDVAAGPDATPTSSYEVPYDYVLDNADVVKQRVINHSGVGKIIQDTSAIPDID
jgi:pectate lyase